MYFDKILLRRIIRSLLQRSNLSKYFCCTINMLTTGPRPQNLVRTMINSGCHMGVIINATHLRHILLFVCRYIYAKSGHISGSERSHGGRRTKGARRRRRSGDGLRGRKLFLFCFRCHREKTVLSRFIYSHIIHIILYSVVVYQFGALFLIKYL